MASSSVSDDGLVVMLEQCRAGLDRLVHVEGSDVIGLLVGFSGRRAYSNVGDKDDSGKENERRLLVGAVQGRLAGVPERLCLAEGVHVTAPVLGVFCGAAARLEALLQRGVVDESLVAVARQSGSNDWSYCCRRDGHWRPLVCVGADEQLPSTVYWLRWQRFDAGAGVYLLHGGRLLQPGAALSPLSLASPYRVVALHPAGRRSDSQASGLLVSTDGGSNDDNDDDWDHDAVVYSYDEQTFSEASAALLQRVVVAAAAASRAAGRRSHFSLAGRPLDVALQSEGAATALLGWSVAVASDWPLPDVLLDVHWSLPQPHSAATVRGHYAFFHYGSGGVADRGWGCAYRAVQTLCSYLYLRGVRPLHGGDGAAPTHRRIQEDLVRLCGHASGLVGSRQWIGSADAGLLLEAWYGVRCRIVFLPSGADVERHAATLLDHFRRHGSPVIVGGASKAYTLLGVDCAAGPLRLLILDPHYCREDDLLSVVKLRGVFWTAAAEFFRDDAFYNLCLPLVGELQSK